MDSPLRAGKQRCVDGFPGARYALGMRTLLFLLVLLIGLPARSAADPVPRKPLVFAHRGASGERPEHTLGAYRLALEQGADFVEPDLRMTRDGIFIALHDTTLDRTTDVADRPDWAVRARLDGRGVPHWYPGDFTLTELKTLRTRQGTKGRSSAHDGQESIPSLAEVVDLVRAHNRASGRAAGLVPELRGHAVAFVEFVRAHDLEGPGGLPLYLQSFELETLKQAAGHLRSPCAWLLNRRPQPDELTAIRGQIDALALNRGLVLAADAADWIRSVQAQGFAVQAWTFADDSFHRDRYPDAEAELAAALANGLDAFFTDFPVSGVRVRDRVWSLRPPVSAAP